MSNKLSKYWQTCNEYKSKISPSFSHCDSFFQLFERRVATLLSLFCVHSFEIERKGRGAVDHFYSFFLYLLHETPWGCSCSFYAIVWFPQRLLNASEWNWTIVPFKLMEIIVHFIYFVRNIWNCDGSERSFGLSASNLPSLELNRD